MTEARMKAENEQEQRRKEEEERKRRDQVRVMLHCVRYGNRGLQPVPHAHTHTHKHIDMHTHIVSYGNR